MLIARHSHHQRHNNSSNHSNGNSPTKGSTAPASGDSMNGHNNNNGSNHHKCCDHDDCNGKSKKSLSFTMASKVTSLLHSTSSSSSSSTSSSSPPNLLFIVLFMGLFFCLFDVLYIFKYTLDLDKHTAPTTNTYSSTTTTAAQVQARSVKEEDDDGLHISDQDPKDAALMKNSLRQKAKSIFNDAALVAPDQIKRNYRISNNPPRHRNINNINHNNNNNEEEEEEDEEDADVGRPVDEKENRDANEEDEDEDEEDKNKDKAAAFKHANTVEKRETKQQQHVAHKFITANDIEGKEPLIKLLQDAGVDEITVEMVEMLPKWSQIVAMYGDKPVYYGLETCEHFQKSGITAEHFVSTAGAFNTGTNLMAEYLIKNCYMPERTKKYGKKNKGVRWQVLWGKHTPVGDEDFRQKHQVYDDPGLTADNIFPAVTVRDPYKWMQSMCRHGYGAKWHHSKLHCPNLLPNEVDLQLYHGLTEGSPIPVSVKYSEFTQHHESLVHFWNDWYNDYYNVKWPRLIVRMEDLVYHPVEVTKTVCECAGGQLNEGKFKYIVDSAKKGDAAHGTERTTYIDALVKYGTEEGRYDGYEAADLEYVRKHLDPKLMEVLGYKLSPPADQIFTTQ